jgi:hypothetical protein
MIRAGNGHDFDDKQGIEAMGYEFPTQTTLSEKGGSFNSKTLPAAATIALKGSVI